MASAFIRTEERFNKLMCYCELSSPETILSESQSATRQALA
jgi:hypothetical protein